MIYKIDSIHDYGLFEMCLSVTVYIGDMVVHTVFSIKS